MRGAHLLHDLVVAAVFVIKVQPRGEWAALQGGWQGGSRRCYLQAAVAAQAGGRRGAVLQAVGGSSDANPFAR